jgi:adenylate cyclase class 2
MQSAEIELKFPVPDPPALEAKLPALGFHLETPRTFEHNTLFDTPDRRLRVEHQILRIRQYGDLCTLTHKRMPGPSDPPDTSRYKVRIETETHLDDGPALATVFEHLGYRPVFVYEKFRSEWAFPMPPGSSPASAHLVIDETAIGNWAELEGPTAWIDGMIAALGIDPATCLTDSYGKLFLDWKARSGSPAENLSFAEILQADTPSLAGAHRTT